MKINEPKTFDILNKILNKEKMSILERKMIFQDDDGSYNLFGTYIIRKTDLGFLVEKKHTHTIHSFMDLRNAVTWSTLDKCQNFNDSSRVLYLDQLLSGTMQNMITHEHLCKRTQDLEKRILYLNKINEDKIKKRSISIELNNYTEKCKMWQYRQFELNSSK
jgi:hypothetical protein